MKMHRSFIIKTPEKAKGETISMGSLARGDHHNNFILLGKAKVGLEGKAKDLAKGKGVVGILAVGTKIRIVQM